MTIKKSFFLAGQLLVSLFCKPYAGEKNISSLLSYCHSEEKERRLVVIVLTLGVNFLQHVEALEILLQGLCGVHRERLRIHELCLKSSPNLGKYCIGFLLP